MASRRKLPLDDDEVLRPLPERPRVREAATIWNEPTVLRGAVRRVSTGETMMRLRKLIAERTGEAWHAVARLRPMTEEDDTRFQVYARCASGQQWVGEYAPEIDEAEMASIVDDVIALRASDVTLAAPKVIKDADGEVIENSDLVGQEREIALANGNVARVKVRQTTSRESATSEEARIAQELRESEMVTLIADRTDYVGWNMVGQWVYEGENVVPRAIADRYIAARREERAAKARMHQVLNEAQSMSWVNAAVRGD